MEISPVRKWKGKTPLTKVKNKTWNVIREYIFNKYRNEYGTYCFTCGAQALEKSNRHLGHFITGSVCPVSLYFDINNLRPQCYRCNVHLSGNWVEFEKNLKEEIGGRKVEAMKKKRWSVAGEKWSEKDYNKHIDKIESLKKT